ncbi:MAG: DUF554 domain-containing protein [Oscillospiraceae bacterium]|nr:DUF554 domain-containing protein [Oscillospiraceae bacterium]
MFGFGTILNVGGVILGGVLGLLFGRLMKERHQDSLIKAIGICVICIGLAGALSGMMELTDGKLASAHAFLVIASLAPGALIGEIINLEDGFERFGKWLKYKTGNAKDKTFVDGFVNASLTICIGAMAVVGSIQDGIYGDWSTLATKAILDMVIILVMTCSLGKGCIFSASPIAVIQGTITLLARSIEPLMTEAALANLSTVGSIMIFCVGINLVWEKKIRVANLLPALVIAVALAFLPFEF